MRKARPGSIAVVSVGSRDSASSSVSKQPGELRLPVLANVRNVMATPPPSLQVTPEVLVDIAGKIPAEVKEALWSAIKSGSYNKIVVSENKRCVCMRQRCVCMRRSIGCGSALHASGSAVSYTWRHECAGFWNELEPPSMRLCKLLP